VDRPGFRDAERVDRFGEARRKQLDQVMTDIEKFVESPDDATLAKFASAIAHIGTTAPTTPAKSSTSAACKAPGIPRKASASFDSDFDEELAELVNGSARGPTNRENLAAFPAFLVKGKTCCAKGDRSLHSSRWLGTAIVSFALVTLVSSGFAQEPSSLSTPSAASQDAIPQPDQPPQLVDIACADPQGPQQNPQPPQPRNPSSAQSSPDSKKEPAPQSAPATPAQQCTTHPSGQGTEPGADQETPQPGQQPKRILGVMPNFRAVSAGAIPPPPTPKHNLWIATQNSFDYSSFIFVGITSLLAEGTDAHKDLGKGIGGFGRYYWRGFLDKTDGNYLVIFALPSILHQDERYYAKGKGPFWKRGIYAASRILITPSFHGHDTFNASELVGRAMAQAISISYYPSGDHTLGALSQKYAYALGRDALTNVFREFWPDIAVHVLHRHP